MIPRTRFTSLLVRPIAIVLLSACSIQFKSKPSPNILVVDPPAPYGLTERVAVPPLAFSALASDPVPATLSATGLFFSTNDLIPAPGVIEYSVKIGLWSDGAEKRRWIALPGTAQITFDANGKWIFPTNTVLVKHFDLEVSRGVFTRLETRVLVNYATGWVGYSYRWNAIQDDATLVTADETQTYAIQDRPGVTSLTWSFPSSASCFQCHRPGTSQVLGLETRQINHTFSYEKADDNQLRAWNNIKLFTRDIGGTSYASYASLTENDASLELRARAYLSTNCSHCHQPDGIGPQMDMRFSTALADTNLVDVAPTNGDRGLAAPARIKSGDPANSMIVHRMSLTSGGRMPQVGSAIVDQEALAIIGTWIQTLR